jgi:hypothetical protein
VLHDIADTSTNRFVAARFTWTEGTAGSFCFYLLRCSSMSPESSSHRFHPPKIVSGGQTGVDRAALDAAIELGIAHGGWCPSGRRAEDGAIPARYRLEETGSTDYATRTERNVVDSDATLILYRGRLSGGTELTRQLARQHGKPCLVVDLERPPSTQEVRSWLADERPKVLNVAGPRESQNPGIWSRGKQFLIQLLGALGQEGP